ncbi:hypothetical protein Nepgr_017540 [Nepenthes gracilis]|uniref:TPX2 C-terminal domain-containing protein n=1 Tax=Nepenthes gracilis TaxID=150966 RepID=A0AAD3SRT3_NEPGR|nr:hypothetical protein Nepgr_017540 [Nepenthes gracilis]
MSTTMATPTKGPPSVPSKASDNSKNIENSNPNLSSPGPKSSSLPSIKSAKSQKSAVRNPKPVFRNKNKERKFVIAKKKNPKSVSSISNCKCKDKIGGKCYCVAYENLRASQEEFFKNKNAAVEENRRIEGICGETADGKVEIEKESESNIQNLENANEYESDAEENYCLEGNEMGNCQPEQAESPKGIGCSTIKRRRDKLLEEARESIPEPGSGRVMHLVKAFEKLLTMPKPKDSGKGDETELEETKKGMKWALPGLQDRPRAPETQDFSFCPDKLFLTAESLGLESRVSSSLDSSHGSISSRVSAGSHRSRRSSSVSSGTVGSRKWKKKQLKVTSLQPFKLRTEQRGRVKEEEFFKKLQEMMIEEERQRIPIAQGLPWTTDEPQCLIKPLVKESTKPIDLKLHTDIRAVERAEFDNQVAEKMILIEQYKMERERQQKLEEEEEVKRLRKELIPKAQPMPYFDRPFIPRKLMKQPTIPKEPKFHFPQRKKIKCCLSWNNPNVGASTQYQ